MDQRLCDFDFLFPTNLQRRVRSEGLVGRGGKFSVRDVGDEGMPNLRCKKEKERENKIPRYYCKSKPLLRGRGDGRIEGCGDARKQRCGDGPIKARSSRRAGGEGCRGEKERKREKSGGRKKKGELRAKALFQGRLCCGARAAVWAL